MAKYYGNIGYVQTTETVPGVWTEVATERFYRGEVPKNTRAMVQWRKYKWRH